MPALDWRQTRNAWIPSWFPAGTKISAPGPPVLLVPGRVTDKVPYDDCFKRSVAEIRKVLPVAEENGVKIAIENVWNDFITKPEQAKAFLDEINSPLVGWHFDIGNVLRYGPPEEWIPVLGKRILKLHIKDFS